MNTLIYFKKTNALGGAHAEGRERGRGGGRDRRVGGFVGGKRVKQNTEKFEKNDETKMYKKKLGVGKCRGKEEHVPGSRVRARVHLFKMD